MGELPLIQLSKLLIQEFNHFFLKELSATFAPMAIDHSVKARFKHAI